MDELTRSPVEPAPGGLPAWRVPLRNVFAAVTAFLAIAIVLAMDRARIADARHGSVREELLELGATRTVVGRLHGQRHPAPRRRAADAATSARLRELATAVSAAGGSETGLLGSLVELLTGDHDAAIARYRQAHAATPSAAVLNDLAVVYLTRAEERGQPLDRVFALSVLEEARSRHRPTPEVAFNRALALESLHLSQLARSAWNDVLAAEDGAVWGDTARVQLADLARRDDQGKRWEELSARLLADRPPDSGAAIELAARQFPHEARQLCERRVLDRVVRAAATGDYASAKHWLDRAESLAARLATERGDRLLADETTRLRRAMERGGGAELGAALEPIRLYLDGLERYDARDLGSAEALLRRAAADLATVGSPLVLSSTLYAEIARFYASSGEALDSLDALLARTPESYGELRGRIEWMMGIGASSRLDFEAAAGHYGRARALIERASGTHRAAILDLLLAENFDRRGEVSRAWSHRDRALRQLAHVGDAQRLYGALLETAQALGRNGHEEVALVVLDEAEATLAAYEPPYARVEVELERARCFQRLDRSKDALTRLGAARAALEDVAPSDFATQLHAQSWLIEGAVRLEEEPTTAYGLLAKARTMLEERGQRVHEVENLLALADAQAGMADREASRTTLADTLEILEATRREASQLSSGIDSFRAARALFDRLIRDALERPGGHREAFAWVERSRAQVVLDAWLARTGISRPVGFEQEIPERLSREVALVEYLAVGDEMLAWVGSEGELEMHQLSASASDLSEMAGRFRDAVAMGEDERREGEELYEALLGELTLPSGKSRLVIVPDESLAGLPVSALVDREGRYLIETTEVSVAPSATLFVLSRQRTYRESLLARPTIVSASQLSGGPYGHLRPLPGARESAVRLATWLRVPTLLLDELATTAALSAAARGATLLHFGGHAVSSATEWGDNALIMAPSGTDDGVLRLDRLAGFEADGLQLVSLASCESLGGYDGGREGNMGVAMSFLALGVPHVVATLWPIQDAASGELTLALYRHLVSGASPSAALRAAQVELLRSSDPELRSPSVWAALQMLGG